MFLLLHCLLILLFHVYYLLLVWKLSSLLYICVIFTIYVGGIKIQVHVYFFFFNCPLFFPAPLTFHVQLKITFSVSFNGALWKTLSVSFLSEVLIFPSVLL